MNMLQTIQPTISSVELVEIINGLRPDDAKELRHDNFMTKIEKHPGIDSPKFLGQYKDSTGRTLKCYNLPKREAELMVMSESLEVQTKVYDRLTALEAREAQRTVAGQSNVFALAMVESMARTLRMSDSGVLLMYRQVANVYAPEAVSAIPVYAIDAPTTATSAPTSSMPTASLTVLLNEHDIGVSAVTANKMLARSGMLEEMTRPSSKGAIKRFWSVTEAGQKYGKNVTSPSNPKETQPHWYRDTFKELVRLHLVA